MLSYTVGFLLFYYFAFIVFLLPLGEIKVYNNISLLLIAIKHMHSPFLKDTCYG